VIDNCIGTGKLVKNILCQLFAKLHSHLIKGIDIPYNALGKDLMLIHC
jgi:hypothetical protein